MPLNIARSDKRLLIWAGVIIAILIVALSLLSDEEEESSVPSTYSSQSAGARAAFLLLKETGYHVEEVHMIDLFPQTFHIESIVRLAR